MKLELESGPVLENPDGRAVANALRRQWASGDGYAILKVSEMTYLQARRLEGGAFILEYQKESTSNHFQCTDQSISTGDVIRAFVSYVERTAEWYTKHSWEKWDFRPETEHIIPPGVPGVPSVRSSGVAPMSQGAWSAEQLQRFSPQEFEHLVARLWCAMGYNAFPTQHTRDRGVDVIATTATGPPITVYIQTKLYSPENTVGVRDVREYASLKHRPGVDAVVIVTSSSFTPDAVREAEEMGVKLVDAHELIHLLDRHRIAGFAVDDVIPNGKHQTPYLTASARALADEGRYVEAVAQLKSETGCSLREAKETVDAYREQGSTTRAGSGCLGTVIGALGICSVVSAFLWQVLGTSP